MQLSPTPDQVAILDALDGLSKPFASMPHDRPGFALTSGELDAALMEGGFLDVALDKELGPVTAALVVERLARLPYATEAAASALVRPLLGEDLAHPVCLVEARALHRPVRFLRPGASVVVVGAGEVGSFTAGPEHVAAVAESLYAYPVAMLTAAARDAERLGRGVAPAAVLARWRVALAAETAGLLFAALASTVAYVGERKQFGRPLATFQALRHRLAYAHVRANGVHWLALKAAGTGDAGDAALAAQHAQESATEVVYDLHQFLGAMGVTLEHPLHLWTYRLKALLGELGGRTAQGAAAAALVWGREAA